jgi:hypothetical protein
MFKKILIALVATTFLVVPFSGIAYAEEDHPEGVRVRGEVVSVDPGAGNFRIETNSGEVLTFFVNEETQFRGMANDLVELKVGWKVGVGARDKDGELWAFLVISGDPEDFIKARGKITDVNTSAGKFTIEKPDGEKMTFFVDEGTRYGGQSTELGDLQAGWQAAVLAKDANPGKLLAVGVVAGDAPELLKVKGTVTTVDVYLGKFEIATDDGRNLSFVVDEKTRYQGQLSSLDEMQVGWTAGVAAKEVDGDQLLAVMVIAGTRPDPVRAQGIIVGVDPSARSFNLEKPDGSVLTFYVDSETNYKGQVSGFSDLEEGMRTAAGGIESDDGKLLAKVVVAGYPQDDRPEIIRAQGVIKTVNPGAGKFQLEKNDGSVLTIYVDEKTNYRGQVNSFDDLEKGMRAGFGGYKQEDGKIIARVIIAGNPPADRPDRPERPDDIRPDGERPDHESGAILDVTSWGIDF